ncbi:MAG TPA: ferric reductase-like transmembrane domain-containing protein [Candidatus Dormibacteraeota bacterium]
MLAAALGPTPLWYTTRASGFTALVLLSATVVVGLLTSARQSGRDWPRFVVQSLHRNLSLLVVVFLLIHIATSVIDPFAKLNLADAIVPFIAGYRPLWLGLGVVSCELLLAITVTSLLRNRLGWRAWQIVHMLAYVSWPVAVVHGIGTGTDTKSVWALLLVTGCVVVVIGALVWRLAVAGPRIALIRWTGMAAGLAGTGALVVWMASGPLQPGWAKAAGTPADLLAGGATGTPAPVPASLTAGLNDPLRGSLVQSSTTATATMTDTRDATLAVVIVAKADGSGSVTVFRSRATICAAPATFGSTTATAQCGAVQVVVQIAQGGGASISGTLTTRPLGA